MRHSLTDLQQSEKYILGSMKQDEQALFEVRLLTDPLLKIDLHFLRKTFSLLRLYHRKKLKQDAAAIHDKLFADPHKAVFQRNILRLFKQ